MEKVEEKAEVVDWGQYFWSIRSECPWALSAWRKNKIDIVRYQGDKLPLGNYEARMYILFAPKETVEAIAYSFDHGEDEWLYSYPDSGPFATPVPVLIQQDRNRLEHIRKQLGESDAS